MSEGTGAEKGGKTDQERERVDQYTHQASRRKCRAGDHNTDFPPYVVIRVVKHHARS